MFCSRCGKEVSETSAFCDSCGNSLHAAAPAYQQAPIYQQAAYQTAPVAPVSGNGRMEGFGKALTGAIFGLVSLILAIVVLSLISDAYYYTYNYYYGSSYYYDEESLIIALILSTPALVFGILSIVFGAKSIATFKRGQKGQKPLVTLILGITALSLGVIGVFMSAYGMSDSFFCLI